MYFHFYDYYLVFVSLNMFFNSISVVFSITIYGKFNIVTSNNFSFNNNNNNILVNSFNKIFFVSIETRSAKILNFF